jgi:tRNA (mo5U34)-methyltransferase
MRDEQRRAIQKRVEAFGYWYHRIELPHGVVTPGWAPLDAAAYRIPDDLSGKRVLDIGAWDGFWSFEALRRGAREVVAIDDFSDLLGTLDQQDRHAWETFDLCRELLGHDAGRCSRHDMSLYDISQEKLGRFDVVFCFGTLYHLRYPLLALDKIGRICDEAIFVESAILDDFSPYRDGIGHGYDGGQMVMEFYPGRQYGNNNSNWWVPSLHCLLHMVGSAGFTENAQGWKLSAEPSELAHCRGFVSAHKP